MCSPRLATDWLRSVADRPRDARPPLRGPACAGRRGHPCARLGGRPGMAGDTRPAVRRKHRMFLAAGKPGRRLGLTPHQPRRHTSNRRSRRRLAPLAGRWSPVGRPSSLPREPAQTWGATPSASCDIEVELLLELEERKVAAGDELEAARRPGDGSRAVPRRAPRAVRECRPAPREHVVRAIERGRGARRERPNWRASSPRLHSIAQSASRYRASASSGEGPAADASNARTERSRGHGRCARIRRAPSPPARPAWPLGRSRKARRRVALRAGWRTRRRRR